MNPSSGSGSNSHDLSGFPTHIQDSFIQASRQVTMNQNSQSAAYGADQSQTANQSHRQSAQPFQYRGQAQGGQGRHRGRGRGQVVSMGQPSSFVAPAPQPADARAFPPLGSTQQTRLPPPQVPSQVPLQGQARMVPQSTNMSSPAEFFDRARAGAYRGNSSQARPRYHPANHLVSPPPTHQSVNNTYARPQNRTNRLYEPSSFPDQQYLQKRIMTQYAYLEESALVALQTALTPAEGQEKEAFRRELEGIAQSTISRYTQANLTLNPNNVKLKCYGSLANGFAVQGSDLDLLLMFPRDEGPLGNIETDCRRLLEKALLAEGYGARLLTNTRVPILRVCQQPTLELLRNLRNYRLKWEEEEQISMEKHKGKDPDILKADRLPILNDEQLLAASKAFAELDLSPTEIPLPPSPVRDPASLEYKGDLGIQCDINFSNYVAIHNTTLLRCYAKCDPRVRDMGLFVKAWAKARKINTPYHGTLSSYGYILMVLHYLMNIAKPPVIPNLQHLARDADAWAGKTEVELVEGFDVRFDNNERAIENAASAGQMTENKQSLGTLLHGFFWYYSDRQGFHWQNEVISIRTVGGILKKPSKGWTEGKWSGENNQVRLRYLLAIEDPFEVEHNIARTVGHSGIVAIRDELRRAWDIVCKVKHVSGAGWQWLKGDGTVGEDLLAKAEDRGDLLGQDRDYNRKKQQVAKNALAARKAEEANVNAQEIATTEGYSSSKGVKNAESGMSSTSVPKSSRTTKGLSSTERTNPKLIRDSKPQATPTHAVGRRRKVKDDSDSSGDELGPISKRNSSKNGEVTSTRGNETLARNDTVQESETKTKSIEHELDGLTSENAESDSYCPFVDPDLLNATVSLRIEDISVRPGSNDDGKPLAWNTNTQPGRWLHWRDQKIRRGIFDPTEHSAGLFNELHLSFPYSRDRPVSRPRRSEVARQARIREKRVAYFTARTTPSTASSLGEGHDQRLPQEKLRMYGQSRKDSAVSGMTTPSPEAPQPRSHRPSKARKEKSALKQRQAPNPRTETTNPGNTTSVAVTESSQGAANDEYDMTLRPRDEDPNIMPIPPVTAFKFDPRQLRDLDIIRQGGNGCARQGEEWNVEIDGEWGGGGIMGEGKTSSGMMTTQPTGGNGGDEWRCGTGDDEGLLGELPNFGAVEV